MKPEVTEIPPGFLYRNHLKSRLMKCRVPEHLREGLVEYLAARRPVGGFLTAVLCNDLAGACRSADNVSRYHLYDVVAFLLNYAPLACWGSHENVNAWLADPTPAPELYE